MSEANPRGAAQALAGQRYKFLSRDVCLTEGVLCALDILGLDSAPVSDVKVLCVLFWLGGERAQETERWLMRGKDELSLQVLRQLPKIFPSSTHIREAVKIAMQIIAEYNSSFCVYHSDHASAGNTDLRISGCGNRASRAAFAMRNFGMSFREYLATPASRINALYAAECEYNGMHGLDTFFGREELERVAPIAKKMQEQADKEISGEKEND